MNRTDLAPPAQHHCRLPRLPNLSLPTSFLPRLPRNLAQYPSEDPAGDLLRILERLHKICQPDSKAGSHLAGEDSGYSSETDEPEGVTLDAFEIAWAKDWLLNVNRRTQQWREDAGDEDEDVEVTEEAQEERHKRGALLEKSSQLVTRLSECSEPGAMIRQVMLPTRGQDRPIFITLHDALPSVADPTSVGLQSWGSSVLLSRMIALDPASFGARARGRRTLELGAGTGLLSLTWKALAERFVADEDALNNVSLDNSSPATITPFSSRPHEIVATDYHVDVLANLKKNLASNATSKSDSTDTCAQLTCTKLDWEAVHASRNFATKSTSSSLAMPAPFHAAFDTILAADVVYSPLHPLWLKSCIEHFLARPAPSYSSPNSSPCSTPLSSPSLLPVDPDGPEPTFHLIVPIRPTHTLAIGAIADHFPLVEDLPADRVPGEYQLAIKSMKELPRVRGIGRADEAMYRLYRIGWA